VLKHLTAGITTLRNAGAEVVAGGATGGGKGFSYRNTLLKVAASRFLKNPAALQTEAFGNSALWVLAENLDELMQVLETLEGNLTGTIYSANDGSDDAHYNRVAPVLRRCVGRLLNDKMPTGVAVSPAMNHGGPFPATGHPGFTAVGIPMSIQRFAMLHSYDGVRSHRLPPALQNKNPTGQLWRLIDGTWSTGDVTA
jgi:NADP-dependent aldehyde dehydrogenase